MPNRVIARFRDGRILRGTTINFRPDATHCHIGPPDQPYGEGQRVDFKDLKALFFVRDLHGNPLYKERRGFAGPTGYGRRVVVKFQDGEEMLGVVHHIDRAKAGFFLFPSDPDSNNERVFAMFDFIRSIEQVEAEAFGAPERQAQDVPARSVPPSPPAANP